MFLCRDRPGLPGDHRTRGHEFLGVRAAIAKRDRRRSGPGQNTIYIRGVASTTPNLTVAGVAGLAPNVAFYLDEQPLAHPGRNLDVYAADLARIEVLSGPQGTLYGASSQAGNVRLITNKRI